MGKIYAFFTSRKLKTSKDFKDAFCHNERIYNVTNADPTREHLNKHPIDLNGKTYQDVVDENIAELQMCGAIDRSIRKDAVKGMELILRYSHEADGNFDQDEWVRANIEWLEKTFNPPNSDIHYTDENGIEQTKKINNVKAVTVHNDEGVPHIHVLIVPIDDRGHLNHKFYFGGRQKMLDMQTSYGKAMEQFGLERGEYKSMATPEKVSRYLTEITKAIDAELDAPQKGETVDEYYKRANTIFQNLKIHHRNEIVKNNQENIRLRSEMIQRFENSHADQWDNKKKLKKLADGLRKDQITDADIEHIIETMKDNKALEEAITELDPEFQRTIMDLKQDIRFWNDKEEEKEKRKEKQRAKTNPMYERNQAENNSNIGR